MSNPNITPMRRDTFRNIPKWDDARRLTKKHKAGKAKAAKPRHKNVNRNVKAAWYDQEVSK